MGQDMAGRGLLGTLDEQTQMTGSDSRARRLKSSEISIRVFGAWTVMTQAGLS